MPETPQKMYALGAIFTFLPIPFVFLRFQARRRTRLPISWDDWLIILSLVANTIIGILLIIGASVGDEGGHSIIGANGEPVMSHAETVRQQTTWTNTVIQVLALGPTKLSVLLFYQRVFRGPRFNIISWVLIALVVMWTVAFFFSNMLTCVPVRPFISDGENEAMGAHCMSAETKMYLAQSYADFSLDFLILVLPLPIIAKLHMSTTRKLQISLVFLTGLMTVAASVTRTAVQYGVARQFNSGNMDAANFEAPIIYWPLIEGSIGIVAASLPTLRPLVEYWGKSTWARSLRSLVYRSKGPISGNESLPKDDASFGSNEIHSESISKPQASDAAVHVRTDIELHSRS